MRTCLAWAFCAFSPLLLVADEPQREASPAEIERLIEQLGDEAYDRREAATRRLVEIGRPAIAALDRAAESAQLETRRRAFRALTQIDPTMRRLAALSAPDLPTRTQALRSLAGYRRAPLMPKLLELLETAPANPRGDEEEDYVEALLPVVGGQRDFRATPLLARMLLASDHTYRSADEPVLAAMAQIKDPAAADAMLKCLAAGPFYASPATVAAALGGTRDPRAVAPLVKMMDTPLDGTTEAGVEQAAIRALANLGTAAVAPLAREYPHHPSFTQRSIAQALGEIGGDAAKAALGEIVKRNDEGSYAAAVALDRLDDSRGAEFIRRELEPLLKDGKPVPWHMYDALSHCRHKSLRAVCLRLLDSPERILRWSAAESLARQGDDAGLRFLRERLESDRQAFFAIGALSRADDQASTQDFVRLARHQDQSVVNASIYALTALRSRAAAQALMDMARGPRTVRGHAELRRDSARALKAFPAREVIELLLELAHDDDERVAQSASNSLVEISGVRFADDEHRDQWWAYHRDEYPPLSTWPAAAAKPSAR